MSTYWIPSINVEPAAHKLAKINRRAHKLGLEPVKMNVLATEMRKVPEPNGYAAKHIEYSQVELLGQTPKINGWFFTGHIDIDEGIEILSGNVPEQYRNQDKLYCEHCGHNRYRTSLFILRNESGEYKGVGTSCLKDFVGVDPATALSIRSIMDFDPEDDEFCGSGGYFSFGTAEIVRITLALIHNRGYISRRDAEDQMVASTSDIMFELLYDKKSSASEYAKMIRNESVKPVIRQEGDEIIETLLAGDDPSEFATNVRAILEAGYVPAKRVPLIVGAVGGLLKFRARKKVERAEFKPGYEGTVGKREVFEVEVIAIKEIESFYGLSVLYILRSKSGHKMTWFSSRNKGWEIGQNLKIKATVKNHEKYNGFDQTQINRATEV